MRMLLLALLILITSTLSFGDSSKQTIELLLDGKKTIEEAIFEQTFVLNPLELKKLTQEAKQAPGFPSGKHPKGKVKVALEIPLNYLVKTMTMYEEIDLATNTLELFELYRGKRLKLFKTKVASGRSARTPTGNFCLKRIVFRPLYFPPPEWGGKHSIVRPGPKNPYGLWYGEILKVSSDAAGYEFRPSGTLSKNGIGEHSTNSPGSIGHYASHGCIRLHPNTVSRLYPFFLHFTPHLEPKKGLRGDAIYPFTANHLIYVKIYRSKIPKNAPKKRRRADFYRPVFLRL